MARVELISYEIDKVNEAGAVALNTALFTALDASDGAAYDASGRDDKTLLLVQNSATSEGTLTVKAGNGIQGVNDLSVVVPASSTVGLVLESGRFKKISGDDKGKIILAGAATLKVAVVKLP